MDEKSSGRKILIVDDSRPIAMKLEMFLKKEGYEVFLARDGLQCLDAVEKINPDLIIMDIYMPRLNGIETCRIIKSDSRTCLIPVVILTASSAKEDKKEAISAGANEFIRKPFDPIEMKIRVESLLRLKSAIDQLENANNIIRTLAKAVEVKDKFLEGHTERVSMYSAKIARRMGLSEQQIDDIAMAGMVHDIGKIGVPDNILNKEGKLSKEEFEIIKNHTKIGYEMLNKSKKDLFASAAIIALQHHEKYDGTGYPNKLKGNEIHIYGRIVCIADVFDSLSSDRVYKKAWEMDKVLEFMTNERGKHFDPEMVDLFIKNIDTFLRIKNRFEDKFDLNLSMELENL